MSNSLAEIAQKLKDANSKVQLIYAFNGVGKTRLSLAFKQLLTRKGDNATDDEKGESSRTKILYYNAFTEDLFYWDNDLEFDSKVKLKIQPNKFTDWVLKDQGQDSNIIKHFQSYANQKLTPRFNEEYKTKDPIDSKKELTIKAFSEVTFSLKTGDDAGLENLKISKAEESNFVWSIFYALLDQVISILNVPDTEERETDEFNQLEYVFIDDPVSSLDENHLIELAVNLAGLIKVSESELKFIITTHSPFFYNVLYNELKKKTCYLLQRSDDGSFFLEKKDGDSNRSFSYHLYLKQILEQAISNKQLQKYHFTLLRNLYEKTATFLGYEKWTDLLDSVPGDKDAYLRRIITFSSHSTLSSEEIAELTTPEKEIVRLLLDNLTKHYGFWHKQGGTP